MLGVPGPKVVKNLLLLLGAAWSAQQLHHVIMIEMGWRSGVSQGTEVTREMKAALQHRRRCHRINCV